jgi:3-phosphoinositide dependent protein kinase-1
LYVSPEMLDKNQAGKEADYWALGCIIYQMLTGFTPFNEEVEYLTYEKILKAEFTFPEEIDQSAKELIILLLKVEPGDRLTNFE